MYYTDPLKYHTQLACKNKHGKFKQGKKVTGLCFSGDGRLLLVTTNDSRVRLFDTRDYTLRVKYKGHVNEDLPIKASFGGVNHTHVISGSHSPYVYVWKTHSDYIPAVNPKLLLQKENRNDSYEYFNCDLAEGGPVISTEPDANANGVGHAAPGGGGGGGAAAGTSGSPPKRGFSLSKMKRRLSVATSSISNTITGTAAATDTSSANSAAHSSVKGTTRSGMGSEMIVTCAQFVPATATSFLHVPKTTSTAVGCCILTSTQLGELGVFVNLGRPKLV
jgi:WD40 repeat protein